MRALALNCTKKTAFVISAKAAPGEMRVRLLVWGILEVFLLVEEVFDDLVDVFVGEAEFFVKHFVGC